jgi:hypothetical protein
MARSAADPITTPSISACASGRTTRLQIFPAHESAGPREAYF